MIPLKSAVAHTTKFVVYSRFNQSHLVEFNTDCFCIPSKVRVEKINLGHPLYMDHDYDNSKVNHFQTDCLPERIARKIGEQNYSDSLFVFYKTLWKVRIIDQKNGLFLGFFESSMSENQ